MYDLKIQEFNINIYWVILPQLTKTVYSQQLSCMEHKMNPYSTEMPTIHDRFI